MGTGIGAHTVGGSQQRPNENRRRLFPQNLLQQGVSHHHWFGRVQRLSGAWESFLVKHYFWHGEAGGGLTTMGASYVVCLGSIFGFLWLVPSWEWGQTGDLAVLAQVLTTMGPLVPRPCSGSLGWCCRASGSAFYSHIQSCYCLFIFSHYYSLYLYSLTLISTPTRNHGFSWINYPAPTFHLILQTYTDFIAGERDRHLLSGSILIPSMLLESYIINTTICKCFEAPC